MFRGLGYWVKLKDVSYYRAIVNIVPSVDMTSLLGITLGTTLNPKH